MTSPAPFTNRLIKEKSPYLLQHAHNPVDWYPWGEEAFEAAKKEDKPILLSIGYATCHWCHVMENESFENPELAKLLNEVFINIKVDREELPGVDSIYMEFAQALMASSGGWPLNVVLTPDLKPFFAVTYLPPKSHKGLIGLDQFAQHINQIWHGEERFQLIEQAESIVDAFARAFKPSGDEIPTEQEITSSVETLFTLVDPVYGGIKGEPKFPVGYQCGFLLEFTREKKDSRSLFFVELSLDMMYRGGIYDHLGGGFSRYSVDEKWLIPHFEKMLYDNAILARTYLDAWRFVKKTDYQKITLEILQYLMRDMAHPEGGFYSAEDSDSEGHEGWYYTWTAKEVHEILPGEEGDVFSLYYGVTPQGNFEGRNVLHINFTLEEISETLGRPVEEIAAVIEKGKTALLQKRAARPRPFRDDKIITSWNGLMIDSLIQASAAFNQPQLREQAIKTAQFIRAQLWKEGRLLRRYRDGEAKFAACLEDYAYLIKGLLSLFNYGCGSEWLEWAIELSDVLKNEFKADKGAFYQTDQHEPIVLRKCEFYDGAEPSGNGVHSENLLRLYQITQNDIYLKQAEDILKAAKEIIEAYPPGTCYNLMGLQRYLDTKASSVVVALDEKSSLAKEIADAFAKHFTPHTELIWKKKGDTLLDTLIPSSKDKVPLDGKTTVYICHQDRCEPPLSVKEEILKALEAI
jgi:uncharacterized protein